MKTRHIHEWLYLANATVLLAHQIDGAYWHEWNLFGLPGGIQLYLLLNLPIVVLILYGARALALERRWGTAISWALVAGGLFAAGFHSFHLGRGDEAFALPVSIGLLAATLVLSLSQAGSLLILQGESGGALSSPGGGQPRSVGAALNQGNLRS